MRPSALLRRLWGAQLRLRVLAGVAVVTLAALAGFDVAAVTVMRGDLISQTDQNLEVALTLTAVRLPLLIPGYRIPIVVKGKTVGAGIRFDGPPQSETPGQKARPAPPLRSLLGEFDIEYIPANGKAVQLEIGAIVTLDATIDLPKDIASLLSGSVPKTVSSPVGHTQLRVADVTVPGGTLVAATSLDQVDKTLEQLTLIVAFGSAAVVLLIGAGVFLVVRRGLRPIESMAAQADRITAGDLTERVTPQSPGSEVGRLGAALNGMLARIEAGVAEREASQEQTRRFFADASHELRTPLASLRANTELYLQGALTSEDEIDEVMSRIESETRRMGRLVDDMLRLARLGQHPDTRRTPVDVTALVAGCADRVRIADPARTWHVQVNAGLGAEGDEELLRRAVDNLLTNVLTHTPRDTAASIIASGTPDTITIEVRDNGPGVSPDTLPHLFERFYRATAGAAVPGAGLGLAIVAEVAAAHGGSATAEPVSPHGLSVKLTVPARFSAELPVILPVECRR
jgi:two-component system, OmpR family, sensor kinase